MALSTMIWFIEKPLTNIVGSRALPYVAWGLVMLILVGNMLLYDFIPSRLVIPIGVACWILTFVLQAWYFWFGPGSLGHH